MDEQEGRVADQTVTIECESCHATWTHPLDMISEDALVSEVARAFLDEHMHTATGFHVDVTPLEGTGSL